MVSWCTLATDHSSVFHRLTMALSDHVFAIAGAKAWVKAGAKAGAIAVAMAGTNNLACGW
jgi:hypothetical protein